MNNIELEKKSFYEAKLGVKFESIYCTGCKGHHFALPKDIPCEDSQWLMVDHNMKDWMAEQEFNFSIEQHLSQAENFGFRDGSFGYYEIQDYRGRERHILIDGDHVTVMNESQWKGIQSVRKNFRWTIFEINGKRFKHNLERMK